MYVYDTVYVSQALYATVSLRTMTCFENYVYPQFSRLTYGFAHAFSTLKVPMHAFSGIPLGLVIEV